MFKRGMLTVLVLLIGLLAVQSATAREFADIYTDCGLGAMIAPTNDAVAALTNVTWDLGTTAISSDISCPESCKGGQAKVAAFIYDAYDYLETDLACGSGEYLDILAEIAEEDIAIDSLRDAFAAQVASDEYAAMTRFEKAEALYNLVYETSTRAS